jgi:hypothetical protein
LAQKTNGSVFDICDSDWSQEFATLNQSMGGVIGNRLKVKNNIKSITSVSVNGVLLSSAQYTFSADEIVIDASQLTGNPEVRVVYKSL